ncbi:hypothetical protein [Chondromyces apiculatus]|uniref:Uncharacterized protein n=1 Tax=Chondromyces apiculatus DSM 436 TaxID=1192034 RepID=A0A017T1L8_9BACT|nr:hypothetical protein [Chondromyces apiculatus]EYF02745.1 Hypothetical protein CAP_6480 [Chondromyces apiculatus DSM 436]
MSEVILAELATDVAKDRRGSVLGAKVELYQHLLISHPEGAERVRRSAQGTQVERLLMHAESMLD